MGFLAAVISWISSSSYVTLYHLVLNQLLTWGYYSLQWPFHKSHSYGGILFSLSSYFSLSLFPYFQCPSSWLILLSQKQCHLCNVQPRLLSCIHDMTWYACNTSTLFITFLIIDTFLLTTFLNFASFTWRSSPVCFFPVVS